jgi:MFS family permease
MRTIESDVPARLDRLPWSRFHWRIVIGLGAVWILDGLQVTVVGAVAPRMTEPGSGIELSAADVGTAAAIYVAGACIGALFFGHLTDRFGRKKLFLATLGLYVLASVATIFAFAPWYFFLCRALTGLGIGGEYSAINTAIDELIPARNRGRVDIAINGSFWLGAGIGGLGALLFLNHNLFALDVGWRLAFASGALLAVAILIVRRNVPESPRWLLIHGREDEAERIVSMLEAEVRSEHGRELTPPAGVMTIRQRKVIPFREIASVALHRYPRRVVLGLALIVGQAFLYNAVTFDLGTILTGFFGVASGAVPYFMVIFAAGNFLGPLLLGRLFDTVGRIPMITGTYFFSAIAVAVLAILFAGDDLTRWSFMALLCLVFFIASAGASSAYLTVSEIFPMETRALSIALFYAVGTALGGITGPLLFGQFIHSGDSGHVAIGFLIGAGAMALGGLAELFFGVRAEGRSLEAIAKPLTAAEADAAQAPGAPAAAGPSEPETGEPPDRRDRIAQRAARHMEHDREGLRRFRPGPGRAFYSPAMVGAPTSRDVAMADQDLDHEIELIELTLVERGEVAATDLRSGLDADGWGPGRFRSALREALDEGRATQIDEDHYGPAVGGRRGGDRSGVNGPAPSPRASRAGGRRRS